MHAYKLLGSVISGKLNLLMSRAGHRSHSQYLLVHVVQQFAAFKQPNILFHVGGLD